MQQAHLGGMFCPPLPDDWRESYQRVIDGLPADQVKEWMQELYDCCVQWDDLPVSTGERGITKHPGHPNATLIHLDQAVADALDPHIPWSEQLLLMQVHFNALEAQASERNSVKASAWEQAVRAHIIAGFYPDDQTAYEKICSMLRSVAEWLGLLSPEAQADIKAREAKAKECEAAIRAAVSAKNYPPVPRPVMEPTPIRNVAKHLLWHVAELDACREPITTDNLNGLPVRAGQ
jgi:hypothetical protein